jgi:hypothetical protein
VAFTAHKTGRTARLQCSCSILPSQQLQEALQTPKSSHSSSHSDLNSITQPATAAGQSAAQCQHTVQVTRRDAVVVPALAGLTLQLVNLVQPQPAAASKLGAAADSAWEAMGGGPADLTFPESW